MPSNIRVAVRVRPLLDNEVKSGHKQNLLKINHEESTISVH